MPFWKNQHKINCFRQTLGEKQQWCFSGIFWYAENKRAKFVAPFHRIAKKVWDIHVLAPSSRCSSLDFVSALLSAFMGQRSNVSESFCWQKSRKMSWAPRWCFYKHVLEFSPPIWGRRWSNPFWAKILTFRWVFPHQPGYLLYHFGCNIFPRPRLLTEEAVQELAGQRIQRSFSLKLCQNSHPCNKDTSQFWHEHIE